MKNIEKQKIENRFKNLYKLTGKEYVYELLYLLSLLPPCKLKRLY